MPTPQTSIAAPCCLRLGDQVSRRGRCWPGSAPWGSPPSSRMRRASTAQPGEVARVEADADQLVPLRAQLLAHLDGVAHPLERVVGVDQEHAVVRHRLGVALEGLQLGVERHHPAVGVRALAPGCRRACRPARSTSPSHPPDVGGPAGGEPAVDPLRPPQAELQHRSSPRRQAQARRLGGDQRLEIDQVEQRASRGAGLRERPVSRAPAARAAKTTVPSGTASTSQRKPQRPQVIEEPRLEERPAVVAVSVRQYSRSSSCETQALAGSRWPARARRPREAAAEGLLAEEEMEAPPRSRAVPGFQ